MDLSPRPPALPSVLASVIRQFAVAAGHATALFRDPRDLGMRDGFVTERVIQLAAESAAELVTKEAELLQILTEREPVLAGYIANQVLVVAGKLAISGAPPEVVRAVYASTVELLFVAVTAMLQGHDQLWAGVDLERLSATSGCNDTVEQVDSTITRRES